MSYDFSWIYPIGSFDKLRVIRVRIGSMMWHSSYMRMWFVRVQSLNIGNGRDYETIGSFRMWVFNERLNINQVLRCSWMLWLRVRLMNSSIVVLCCVSKTRITTTTTTTTRVRTNNSTTQHLLNHIHKTEIPTSLTHNNIQQCYGSSIEHVITTSIYTVVPD